MVESSTHSRPLHFHVFSGQLHCDVVLFPGNSSRYPLDSKPGATKMNVQDLRFSQWFCWIQVFCDVMCVGWMVPNVLEKCQEPPTNATASYPTKNEASYKNMAAYKIICASVELYNSTPPMNPLNFHRYIITFKPLAILVVFSIF